MVNEEQALIQANAEAFKYCWYGQLTASGRVSQTLIDVAFIVRELTYAQLVTQD